MLIETLIEKIKLEIDGINLETLSPDTVFTEIDGWNSLYGLILMALTSTEYEVELSGKQIQNIRTVQDLYNEIQKATVHP